MQPDGSTARYAVRALRHATWLAYLVAGCAKGGSVPEGLVDAHPSTPDARVQHDAHEPTDAAPDAPPDAAGCAITSGVTPSLDGNGDLAKYPAAQQLAPGA